MRLSQMENDCASWCIQLDIRMENKTPGRSDEMRQTRAPINLEDIVLSVLGIHITKLRRSTDYFRFIMGSGGMHNLCKMQADSILIVLRPTYPWYPSCRQPWYWLDKRNGSTSTCVTKLTSIGSDNGLSPYRRQAIVWTNAGVLLIGPLGKNFNEILT